MTSTSPRPSARERLLASAQELFYAEGVQSVGIDRVIEHAGVAKASLYNTFGSKEALVLAYLDQRHQGTVARMEQEISLHDDPRERLLAPFDAQASTVSQPGFHGCAFVTASPAAAPGSRLEQSIDDYRSWLRGLFVGLARDAGAPDPESLGRRLHLLYDGASLAARLDRDPSVSAEARAAAEELLDRELATD